MRKLLIAVVAAAIVAAIVVTVAGSDSAKPSRSLFDSPQEAVEPLQGAPAPLAALYEQPSELLPGGVDAFKQRLRELRGHPVVVNKWAAWCGPCRFEFPHFQRLSSERGKEVAFIGVDSNDNDDDAKKFLSDFPVPYPSYSDPRLAIATSFKAVQAFPSTAFYDSKGELAYLKQGVYKTEADLARDIDRYAK